MKGRKEKMKNRGKIWEKRERKRRLISSGRKGKGMALQQFLFCISAEISEYEMRTTMRILDKDRRPSRSLQKPTIFSDEICSLKAQNIFSHRWV